MWRTDVWEATSRQTIVIPFIRFKRAQPVVRLRNLATGREIWVINVHNAPRGYQAQRNEDVRIEIAKIKQLRESGLPVFFVGDMNEKATVFCKVVGQTDLFSPMGGNAGPGWCNPPKTLMRIDWIFGSAGVRFDTFRMYDSELKRWTTDHRIPVSKISVP
jgi:endonuclease/exonuclease/phosphatase family metal-dependent hydrolase